MDLENIKSLWDKEKISETPEFSLDKQKEIRMPLEKIRQNMKMEFWMSVGVLPVLLVYGWVIKDYNRLFYIGVTLMLFLIIIGYYFRKFYRLYQKISTREFKTYHHLLNLRYELILNSELYKSYYVSTVPIFVLFAAALFSGKSGYAPLFMFTMTVLTGLFIMYIIGKIWLKNLYGVYILQISDLVDGMINEESDFVFNRGSLESKSNFGFLDRSKPFFNHYFGKRGDFIHLIFWVVLAFFLLMFISYIVGYSIGNLASFFNSYDAENIKHIK